MARPDMSKPWASRSGAAPQRCCRARGVRLGLLALALPGAALGQLVEPGAEVRIESRLITTYSLNEHLNAAS
jgi:hypothetical protein